MGKIIAALFIFILLFVYGGKAWDNIKERVNKYINPAAQKALMWDNLKNNINELENIITEVNNNPGSEEETKLKLNAGLELIKKTQNEITELENIENKEKNLINKTIKAIKNIKKLTEDEEKDSSPETSPKIVLPLQDLKDCQEIKCQCVPQ